jgi:hypothetical protein
LRAAVTTGAAGLRRCGFRGFRRIGHFFVGKASNSKWHALAKIPKNPSFQSISFAQVTDSGY